MKIFNIFAIIMDLDNFKLSKYDDILTRGAMAFPDLRKFIQMIS